MRTREVVTLLAVVAAISCRTVTPQERAIDTRDKENNGISVGSARIYDDALLQQMLIATETHLASLNLLDQTGISSHLGAITGAQQQVSSFALNAAGTPTPQSVLTANGATKQVADTTGATSNQTVTTTTAPVQNTVTTIAPLSAAIPTPAAPSATLPSSYSVSAADLLNEQMQLTYEIANLRLLLDGALSDQLFVDPLTFKTFVKPHITLGFPITINPDARFRDSAAIVEVTIDANPYEDYSGGAQPPTVTALLPREKTYNVAAITERNTALGAGVVTQVAAVSGSFLHSQKTYYIAKDQDTVALVLPLALSEQPSPPCPQLIKPPTSTAGSDASSSNLPPPPPCSQSPMMSPVFAWEFRPVLGQPIVQAGLKQTFVQLAFAMPRSTRLFGTVRISTYWRKYDRDTGLLRSIVPGSLKTYSSTPILGFNLTPEISAENTQDLEDLGNGQILVKVPGLFLTNTSVRIGATMLQSGSGLSVDSQQLRFLATTTDLATKPVYIVAPDGTETQLLLRKDDTHCHLRISNASVKPIDENNSLVEVWTTPPDPIPDLPPLTLILGGKVFGYADAPLDRANGRLAVVVPTSFVLANHTVTVKPLLTDDQWSCSRQLVDTDATPERITLIAQSASHAEYLVTGDRLDALTVRVPSGATLQPLGVPVNAALLRLTLPIAKTLKTIVLQRAGERPITLAMPALTTTADGAKQPLRFAERVTVGADEATIVGDGVKDISKVVAQKIEFTNPELSSDGKSLRIRGLASTGITAIAKTVDCTLVPKSGKAKTIQLEIVSSKVESVPK